MSAEHVVADGFVSGVMSSIMQPYAIEAEEDPSSSSGSAEELVEEIQFEAITAMNEAVGTANDKLGHCYYEEKIEVMDVKSGDELGLDGLGVVDVEDDATQQASEITFSSETYIHEVSHSIVSEILRKVITSISGADMDPLLDEGSIGNMSMSIGYGEEFFMDLKSSSLVSDANHDLDVMNADDESVQEASSVASEALTAVAPNCAENTGGSPSVNY